MHYTEWLFADGIGGVFGDWAAGISETWQAKRNKPLAEAERKAFKERCEQEKQARQAERDQQHAEARGRAERIWRETLPETAEHRYLRDKGVNAHGIHTDGQRLVIPLRDTTGTLHSVQYIDPRGEKRYLTDGRVSGCYHAIGKPNGLLCIGEGYATGAAIYEATGHPVAVAFDAGNLAPVAEALRTKYPDLRLVLCADNDIKPNNKNTGLESARAAAQAVGGFVAVPELAGEKCDFHDLMRERGANAVKSAIESATMPATEASKKPQEPSQRTTSKKSQATILPTSLFDLASGKAGVGDATAAGPTVEIGMPQVVTGGDLTQSTRELPALAEEARKRMTSGKGVDGSGGRGQKKNPASNQEQGFSDIGRASAQAAAITGAGQSVAPNLKQRDETGRASEQAATLTGVPLEPIGQDRSAVSIDVQANQAATSPANALPEPTAAQQAAGNYKKGKVRLHGLEISIENPAGSTRAGVDPQGKPWRSTAAHHYGYIRRTEGKSCWAFQRWMRT